MMIASWNVNSLRVRLPQVLDWLTAAQPDILALQETKLQDEQFPREELLAAGYQAAFSGQKTYNGVAILTRETASDVLRDIPGLDDPQRRILALTCGGVRVINLYVPNGESVASDKYRYKLDWFAAVTEFVRGELAIHPDLVVLGDFNIAPAPLDVHDPAAWEGQVLFSMPERAAFDRLLATGLCDTLRLKHPDETVYSWWDYRMAAFRRNLGLRIDHILASQRLCERCLDCRVDATPRAWERPSDHAPVIAEFER
ncbi:MAG: exodeoxyribonuclease III [Gammaproteobacteria bacterium]|nr:exodeoxyribonuclease III [Gammaproteobacteria bacterium]